MSEQNLGRRDVLGLFGAAVLVGCGVAETMSDGGTEIEAGADDATSDVIKIDGDTCVLDPNVTKGPYWIDEMIDRSDITSDTNGVASPNPRPGLPLTLKLAITAYSGGSCAPY